MFLNGCLYKQMKQYTKSVECFQKVLLQPPYKLTTATIWFIIATIFEESNSAQANAAYRRFYSTLVRDDKMDKYKDWNEARQDKDVWVKIGKTLHDLVFIIFYIYYILQRYFTLCNDLYLEAYKVCNTSRSGEDDEDDDQSKSNICSMICETAVRTQNKSLFDEYIKKPELSKEQINKMKNIEKQKDFDLDVQTDETTERLLTELENKRSEESLLATRSFPLPEKLSKKRKLSSRKASDEVTKLKKRIMKLETDNKNFQRNTFKIDALLKELEEKKREIIYLRKLLDELREKEKMIKAEEDEEDANKKKDEKFDIVQFLQQNKNLTAEQKRILLLRKRCFELYSIIILL